ncbi:MAG: DegQ family serine endoprotease [Thiohalocapsa sp.]
MPRGLPAFFARRSGSLLATAASLALLLMPALGSAQDSGKAIPTGKNITATTPNEISVKLPSLAPLVEHVLPAVVNISVELGTDQASLSDQSADERDQPGDQPGDESGGPFDQFLRRFFEHRGMPQLNRHVMALGSGFIIDPAGYIVTNNHVVGHASKVTAILQDNSRHPAKIIGRDEKTDLALIKIDSDKKLPFVTWGNSDAAKVGDWVVAVGNPFGLGGSVTAGIISALGRNINEGPYDDFIQIDAPINRGNSGGPTFNLTGEVIGINTAIYSPSGGSVGIGFAVPSNTAKSVIAQLKENGHVTRGWLGVSIQSITPTIAKGLGLNPDHPQGALVAAVTPDSPAAKVGLKQGDVILKAGDHPIRQVHDLPRVVAAAPIGKQLDLTVARAGKEMTLSPTIAQMPENMQQLASASSQQEAAGLGLQLAALTPELRSQFHIPKDVEGVVVTQVASGSPVGALGIERGDVIMSIDQQPATSPQKAAAELKQAASKGNVLLLLNRHGVTQFVGLTVTPGVGGSRPE